MNQLGCVSLAKDWIQYSSTFVTLSRFFGWKEIRIVCNKIAQKAIAYVVATWQRLDNVGQRRCHNVGDRRRHNSHFRPCDNVVTTSTTTLWQRCHNVVVPAGRELTSAHSQQPESKQEPLVSDSKSLSTKLCALKFFENS